MLLMTLSPPQQIALIVIAAACAIALVATVVRRRRTFADYEDAEPEVRVLVRRMNGELSREDGEIVIHGEFKSFPVMLRFSNADNTPGLTIAVGLRSTVALFVEAASSTVSSGGRAVIRTNDPFFDSRFRIRTDNALEARMLLTPTFLTVLRRICCSVNTRVKLATGELVLSEAVIPNDTANHVLSHLGQIHELARDIQHMPGADAIKVAPFRRKRHLVRRAAIGVAAVLAVTFLFVGGSIQPQQVIPKAEDPSGVLPIDARLMGDLRDWRVATLDDFDPSVLTWMKDRQITPEGRMSGDFSGKQSPTDVAYFLISKSGRRRLVLLSEGRVLYDGQFASLAGVFVVPKNNIDSIEWAGGHAPAELDGDALLVVRKPNEMSGDLVLFRRNGQVAFGQPLQYDAITVAR